MKNLLYKELKLSSMVITYFFILFGLMTFLPGYPIVMGSFFVCMGIFYSFQFARESNDPLYTVLLPVAKTEAVKSKFIFVLFVEAVSFVIMAICTVVRMTLLCNAEVYRQNALLSANLFYLGFCLIMFGLFNLAFVRGYFKTAYKIGDPFLIYCICALVLTGVSETVRYIPGLAFFATVDFSYLPYQLSGFFTGLAIFAVMTLISYKMSQKSFEKLDF